MKKVAFTICAKNYLAQAITLKQSFLSYNIDSDFYIYLSDIKTESVKTEVRELDNAWIPGWEDMAFKYGVVEFSTSIKPFCIKHLFDQGYNKVLYLDPDTFVTNELSYLWDLLDLKSAILTPHYCKMQENYNGTTTEEELLFVGIYNLGFFALKNNKVGNDIVRWWANRLRNKCYYDKEDALHVDQKWMDFLPAFYPEEVEICRHPGINTAIWNLHERSLHYKDGHYSINYIDEKREYELLLFHFSGFDPYNKKVINRRFADYNINKFPSFKPIVDEYVKAEYENGYEYYSKLQYSFNLFDNGEYITRLQRRLYREISKEKCYKDVFSSKGPLYTLYKHQHLLSNVYNYKNVAPKSSDISKRDRLEIIVCYILKKMLLLFGVKRYTAFLDLLKKISRLENQSFLLE